jgi:two-component system, OmpR family, alkaline phosphatase synthesis response regulator PhoP
MQADNTVQPHSRILLVEDEIHLARMLQFNLEQEGHEVRQTPSGREALQLHAGESFDLIILDVMIEEVDGFEVARQIRRRDQKLPILMLTARSADRDRIQGLEVGVDDYIIKPFHLRELLLRVQRILERATWYQRPGQSEQEIQVAGFRVHLDSLCGEGPRGTVQLTVLEAKLVEVLVSAPNRVWSRAELLEKVWDYQADIETRTVDNFMMRLRRHFEAEPDQPRHFVSVRGRGYMYVP